MSLSMRAVLRDRDLDLSLEVATGQTLGILGANASGKSSVLGVIAGLLRADAGEGVLDGKILYGPDVWIPPHQRRIGLLAQEPLLFPHMTVIDNVAFGPRSLGRSRTESTAVAQRWLAEVEALDLAERRPSELSGGQQQRVALARALATDPRLLLLDEPLSATDVEAAAMMRQTLRRVLADRTAIIVSHHLLDAVLLCDRVAVLEAGRVQEQGATDDVFRRPRSGFAASISGVNMMRGVAVGTDSLVTADGTVVHGEPDTPLTSGESAVAIFRPEAVSVHRHDPGGSPRNHFAGAVSSIEPQAHLVRIRVGELSADITADSVARLQVGVGEPVVLVVKAAEVSLYHG
jgi:molybdate transport system ATP-binding protein